MARLFKRGEPIALCKAALAKGPMTTRELAHQGDRPSTHSCPTDAIRTRADYQGRQAAWRERLEIASLGAFVMSKKQTSLASVTLRPEPTESPVVKILWSGPPVQNSWQFAKGSRDLSQTQPRHVSRPSYVPREQLS